jgi:thiol-disulfide isomerase/thioredoxin
MRTGRASPTTNWSDTIRSSRAAIAVLALLLAFGCARSGTEGKAGAPAAKSAIPADAGTIGSQAPGFELADLSGKKVTLADFKGKVVILDFWATWCGPCREEIPDFVKLQAKYKGQGLEIVGLSLDDGGEGVVRPFAEKHNVNYTMLLANPETADRYGGVVGIPTTFVLDRQGRIVKKFIGMMGPQVFEEAIQPLLAG